MLNHRRRWDWSRPAPRPGIVDVPEQWLVLVTCRDEKQQVGLFERFRRDGIQGRALVP
jgi:hypothetical protein